MKQRPLLGVFLFAAGLPVAHAAQQPPSVATSVTSSPGKAAAVTTAEITATVVAIDKATRTVTLKGPQGRTLDVVCGEEVKNFDQIRIGDQVNARYQESLTLGLKKAQGPASTAGVAVTAGAAPGARPAGLIGREVQVLADVVAVEPAKRIITL
jgi:hypothetical protein